MPRISLTLRHPHKNQIIIHNGHKRYNVVTCGRRFGKSELGIQLITRPGYALHGQPVAWAAPTYKVLDEAWREVIKRLRPVIERKDTQQRRIELVTGSVIDFWTLTDPDAGRSRKYKRLIIDESAMCRHLKQAWEESLRPTLTDLKGDAFFLSTPKGLNFHHTLHQRGLDELETEWAAWQMPTTANPYIDPAEVEEAKRNLPERVFKQEYLAEFIDDGGLVFRFVNECATASEVVNPVTGHQYVIGVDWARTNDFTVFTVFDVDERKMVARDRFNNIDYHFQVERLKALHKRFNSDLILAELNSMGGPLVEQLSREGLPVEGFQTTNQSKREIIENLMLAFENLEISIIHYPDLIAELLAFDCEMLPGGALRYAAPDGQHDDSVISLALAWQAVQRTPKKMNVELNFATEW